MSLTDIHFYTVFNHSVCCQSFFFFKHLSCIIQMFILDITLFLLRIHGMLYITNSARSSYINISN